MKALAGIMRLLQIGARIFLWGMLALLLVRGTSSILKGARVQPTVVVAGQAQALSTQGAGQPDLAIQSVAAMFAREYFTVDIGNPDQHARRLAPYLAANLDHDAGLQVGSVKLSQFTETVWPYEVKETAPGRFLVTVVATVRTVAPPMPTPQPGAPLVVPKPEVRNLALAVPVGTAGTGGGRQYVVWDLPHAVPVPAVASAPPDPYQGEEIRDEQVQALLEGFFKAYTAPGATQESLGYFFLDKKPVPPLRGSWAYQSLSYRLLQGPAGALALVDVELRDTTSAAVFRQRFTLQLAKDGSTWFIRQLEPDLQRKEG